MSLAKAAADLGDHFLVAAHRAFARRNELDLPALLGGEALVHAEEVAGKQRRLVAAGAGADLDDHVALVHGVLGKERKLDLLLEPRTPLFERRLLGARHGAHLGVGRRVGEQGVEALDLGRDAPIGPDGINDRAELGELA